MMRKGKESFGKHEKIRKRSEYLTVYERGRRRHSANFTVIVLNEPGRARRLGITVSRRVGNAVERNRIKRLVREFFRLNKHRLVSSQDIVIIGKKFPPAITYQDVYAELEGLLINSSDA